MLIRFAAYIAIGIAVFFALRRAFQKARLDPRPHERIWASCLYTPEGWIFGILLWPLFAIASILWFAADLLHAGGKKEVERAAEIEAQRDKRFDGLDTMQKIERLKAVVESEYEK